MADVISDGMTRVYWVPSIANIAAPTVAELDAGIALTSLITDDGMEGWEAESARVPNTSLASTTDTERIGRDKLANPMLRFKAQSGSDTVKTTLTRTTLGYIAIRRLLAETTAWTAAQNAQITPVECGRRKDLKPEPNTMARYEIPFANHTAPSFDAVVAA